MIPQIFISLFLVGAICDFIQRQPPQQFHPQTYMQQYPQQIQSQQSKGSSDNEFSDDDDELETEAASTNLEENINEDE